MSDAPRALTSFGVAGLLAEDAKVYYGNDLRARNLGRVSDLMAAKLREIQADELRLRAALLFGVFDAYAALGRDPSGVADAPAVALEIGVDSEWVAVGLGFEWAENARPDFAGIEERMASGMPLDAFEELTGYLYRHSNRCVVRYRDEGRRVEVVSLFRRTTIDFDTPEFAIVEVESNAAKATAQEYVELGDLDYVGLLADPARLENPAAVGEEDSRVSGTVEAEDESETRLGARESESQEPIEVKGRSPERSEEETRVSGGDEEPDRTVVELKDRRAERDESVTRLGGAEEPAEAEERRFKGGSEEEGDAEVRTFKASTPTASEEVARFAAGGAHAPRGETPSLRVVSSATGVSNADKAEYEAKIQALQRRIRDLEKSVEAVESAGSERVVRGSAPEGGEDEFVFKSSDEGAARKSRLKIRKFETGDTGGDEDAEGESDVMTFSADAKDVAGDREKVVVSQEKDAKPWGKGFLKKVLNIGGEEESAPSDEDSRDSEEGHASEETDAAPSAKAARKAKRKIAASGDDEPADEGSDEVVVEGDKKSAEIIHREIQEINKITESEKSDDSRVVRELRELRESETSERAKKHVDSLMTEYFQERAKLNELSRNIELQLKQREFEFDNKERSLKQELRRRDEQLKQKNALIAKKTEQIAQAHLEAEKAKGGGGAEEQALRSKFTQAQKLATMKEEENRALVAKMRDLENRLMTAQAKARPSVDTQLMAKMAAAEKKIEEFKRINQRLTDSLAANANKTSDRDAAEAKRKLEIAERTAVEAKKNLEKSVGKMRELQDSERRMKVELARLQEENKKLKLAAQRAAGEGGRAA